MSNNKLTIIEKPIKKRRHVKIACTNCRRSKARCDKERPCKRCVSHSLTCRDDPSNHKNISFPTKTENTLQTTNHNTTQLPITDDIEMLRNRAGELTRISMEKHATIFILKKNIETNCFFSSLPLSRWKIICTGNCALVSFSDSFAAMVQHPQDDLQNFTCTHLYPRNCIARLENLKVLLCSGVVESLSTRVPIVKGNGKVVDVFSMYRVEFENDIPVGVVVCMNEIETHQIDNTAYFEPLHVKTKVYKPNIDFMKNKTKKQPNTKPGNSPSSIDVPVMNSLLTCTRIGDLRAISAPKYFSNKDFEPKSSGDSLFSFPVK